MSEQILQLIEKLQAENRALRRALEEMRDHAVNHINKVSATLAALEEKP